MRLVQLITSPAAFGVSLVTLCFVARAAGAQDTPASQSVACPVETRAASKVRLDDGRTIYIEPMAFARNTGSWILAGEPLYVWHHAPGAQPRVDTAHSFVGAVFTSDGVSPLPKPPVNGIVTHLRLLADGTGYAAVFAVTDVTSVGLPEEKVLQYWFGRTDGRAWHSLERLPLPPGGPLNGREATPLVRAGDTLMIAALFGPHINQDVVVYTRSSTGWSFETVDTDGAAYVALAVRGTQPHVYTVEADRTRLPDSNSLVLYERGPDGWRKLGFLIRGGDRPVHHPRVIQHAGGQTMGWRENDNRMRTRNARAARIAPDGTLGPRATVARDIGEVVTVLDTAGPSRWVISRPTPDGKAAFALIEWTDGEPLIRDIIVDPYTGPALAHATDSGDVIVGPLMSVSPDEEIVVSGVVRFAKRCQLGALSGAP